MLCQNQTITTQHIDIRNIQNQKIIIYLVLDIYKYQNQ